MYVYKHPRLIALWISMCAVLVASMVLVGGYTRLSGSGLSITQWKPIHGVIPPMNEAEWQEEFAHYRESPQYQKINKGMSLAEFKTIFWPEFWHRVLGRLIGVVFFIPLAIFWLSKSISHRFALRMTGIFALGGLQGFIGWYMVASGLVNNPYVSHLRLAAHLAVAFLIFALLLWALLDVLSFRRKSESPTHKIPASVAMTYKLWFALLCLQIIYGAFMAGLHAGLLFNTYPTMDGAWIPEGVMFMRPLWLNLFENRTTIQLIHRTLALLVILGFAAWWFINRRHVKQKAISRWCIAIFLVIALQFALGVLTLLNAVPLYLALKHQMVALLLFGLSVILWYRLAKS